MFAEEVFPFKEKYKELVPQYQTPLLKAWQLNEPVDSRAPETVSPVPSVFNKPIPETEPEIVHDQVEVINDENENTSAEEEELLEEEAVAENDDAEQVEPVNTHTMITRAKAGIQKPNKRYALIASRYSTEEPKSIEAAMKHPGWNNAVMDEMERIYMLNTWSLVLPTADMNILSSKWIFTTKLNPDTTLDKLKASLVAKGFDQEEGLDYLETFSPVVRTATIRVVLNVATAKEWPIKQLDVSNAFLHGELKEPVYMYQPAGFVDTQKPNHVCKLTKALYGLKQAPRAWYDTFSLFLIEFGFTCSKSDPSLFVYHHQGKHLVLLLYVDDMLFTGSDQTLLRELLEALNTKFSMKDLGEPKYFLGIEIVS